MIGGATLLPLPPDEEFEIGWQLHRREWGHGYATETGLALARWAFGQGIEQVIALVRPANARAAAMMRRMGMEWVGETEKYHNLRLQEFRLRPGTWPDGCAAGPDATMVRERLPSRSPTTRPSPASNSGWTAASPSCRTGGTGTGSC